jgi:hypothetical protein
MTRRTIPEIRERLHEVALAISLRCPHEAAELHQLAEETRREYAGRRARTFAPAVTDRLAACVREYARAHPREPFDRIGRLYGLNIGRVSEILHGKRGER